MLHEGMGASRDAAVTEMLSLYWKLVPWLLLL